MIKYIFTSLIVLYSGLSASAISMENVDKEKPKKQDWGSFYLGMNNHTIPMFLVYGEYPTFFGYKLKDPGILIGYESPKVNIIKFMDRPLFDRYAIDFSFFSDFPLFSTIRLSGIHYWTVNKNVNFFSRIGAEVVAVSLADTIYDGDPPLWSPLYTCGFEFTHANDSTTKIELGYLSLSCSHSF